ncbi:MAG TPA: LCP family protein, partial [Candidatus Saccharimonadales bacterium]|nr:LCP family protein [Candidatus Saccharimonadales bacterium]
MRQKKSKSIDDFVVRRRPTVANRRLGLDDMKVPSQYLVNPDSKHSHGADALQQIDTTASLQPLHVASGHSDSLPPPQQGTPMSNNGIDMTLDGFDLPQKKKKRRFFHKPSKRLVKIIGILLLVVILAFGAFYAWKIFSNAGRVFNGNPLGAIFGNKPLKQDANGRTNVLIFGTSEDDPGHDGANLTDSIMVASIDQKKKDAYLLSVPRDLWVKFGAACNSGYEGKINEVYLCGKTGGDENSGGAAIRAKVGEVTGLDLQYSVHINYTVLKEAVDAVGGVDVTIASSDPRGILDRNFDWNCPGGRSQSCYNVKYPNGPVHLDGIHALYLARARGDDPLGRTYGLAGGNFDR